MTVIPLKWYVIPSFDYFMLNYRDFRHFSRVITCLDAPRIQENTGVMIHDRHSSQNVCYFNLISIFSLFSLNYCDFRCSSRVTKCLGAPRIQENTEGMFCDTHPSKLYIISTLFRFFAHFTKFLLFNKYKIIDLTCHLTHHPATRAVNPTRVTRVRVITPGRVG